MKIWDGLGFFSSWLGKLDDFNWKKNIFLSFKYEKGVKNLPFDVLGPKSLYFSFVINSTPPQLDTCQLLVEKRDSFSMG